MCILEWFFYAIFQNAQEKKGVLKQLHSVSGVRFNTEVQPTLSLNLNSELTDSEVGKSEFLVSEWLNWVSLFNSE